MGFFVISMQEHRSRLSFFNLGVNTNHDQSQYGEILSQISLAFFVWMSIYSPYKPRFRQVLRQAFIAQSEHLSGVKRNFLPLRGVCFV